MSYLVHALAFLKSHSKFSLKVLRYLKASPGKGIYIVKCSNPSLEAFVNVDWAKCVVTNYWALLVIGWIISIM